jgi:thioredoxin-dependent peroxiredoxin
MLKVGDKAPPFEVRSNDGKTLTPELLRGKPYVLYFFPKSFTPGCTIETKAFRDAYPELSELGVEVIGVSADTHQTQCDFARSTGATFPMVGDSSGELIERFDVKWPIFKRALRVTYLIDGEGVVRGVFHHELDMKKHVVEVKKKLSELKPA